MTFVHKCVIFFINTDIQCSLKFNFAIYYREFIFLRGVVVCGSLETWFIEPYNASVLLLCASSYVIPIGSLQRKSDGSTHDQENNF